MKVRRQICALSVAFLLSSATPYAQNQQPASPAGGQASGQDPRVVNPDAPLPPISTTEPGNKPPAPAGRGLEPAYEPADADPAQAVPDTHTLAGVEPIGIGSLGGARDIFDPSIIFSVQMDSRANLSNGGTGWRPYEVIGGQLNFNRLWRHDQFTAVYNGGETIYNSAAGNGSFHDVVLQQQMNRGRWNVHLLDDFMYSPQAAFGGGGMGGPGLIGEFSSAYGSTLQTLGEGFVPSETIQTGFGNRYRNVALGQVEYSFSRRSAFTVAASYGFLNFVSSGYVSSRQATAQVGYDYQLDPKNTVAVLGSYGVIHYVGGSTSTEDYSAALAYGRRITGRLGFEVSAGPEQVRATGTINGNFQFWMASVHSALTYQLRRTRYTASYIRGLTSGDGVFFGARTNTIMFSASHSFTRFWVATLNSGYAFNQAIVPAGATATSFNHWYVGASAGKQLNAHIRVDFNYGLQKQDLPSFCPVLSCGVNGYEHTFGVTANWHLRPLG